MCNPRLIINALERNGKLEILSKFHWATIWILKYFSKGHVKVIKIHFSEEGLLE